MLLARKTGERTQSLREHCRSVAAMTAAHCEDLGLFALGRLAGLIHDIGKAYSPWQHYLMNDSEKISHSPAGVAFAQRFFAEEEHRFARLTLQLLCLSTQGHHGGLRDVLSPLGEPNEPQFPEYTQEELREGEKSFFEETASPSELLALFRQACDEVEVLYRNCIQLVKTPTERKPEPYTRKNEVMFYMGLALRFLYSSLIDADRLDAAGEVPPARTIPEWDKMKQALERHLKDLERGEIGQLRSNVSKKSGDFNQKSGVYRMYVPTGGGKTLSSLRLGLNIAELHEKHKLFFIIPFLTILEQNAKEIRKAIGEDEEFRESGRESAVLEHHSNISETDFETDKEAEICHRMHAERWDKKIVMTSTVQFLNVLFSAKSVAARRMQALANSVIVIDEVQAIPTYCTYFFNLAVNFLAHFCSCTVILCTATQPELAELSYPLRFGAQRDILDNTKALFAAFKRTEFVYESDKRYRKEALSDFVTDRLLKQDNCLVIMNTKAMAKYLFDQVSARLSEDYSVYYLSTELCPAHRTEKIAEIKERMKTGKILVISTQLIEAGVDISFCCVIRALAGLDSLIQAAGRCNRHNERELGLVYLVNCEDENLSMLPDIEQGKSITSELLAQFPDAEFDSPEMIRRYYQRFYTDAAKRLAPEIGQQSGISLLGYHKDGREAFEKQHPLQLPGDLLAQSFRTVGRAFKPIADDTTGLVVPCSESEQLIERLRSTPERDRLRFYRALQKYSINVYENKKESLRQKGAASYDKELDLWLLHKGFYDSRTGIAKEFSGDIDRFII